MFLLTIEKLKDDGDMIVMGFRFDDYVKAYLVMDNMRKNAESALHTRLYITDVNGDTRAIAIIGRRESTLFPNEN